MKQFKRFAKNNKEAFVGFRITNTQNIQLQDLADSYGVNKSLLVREAINELLIKHA